MSTKTLYASELLIQFAFIEHELLSRFGNKRKQQLTPKITRGLVKYRFQNVQNKPTFR